MASGKKEKLIFSKFLFGSLLTYNEIRKNFLNLISKQ